MLLSIVSVVSAAEPRCIPTLNANPATVKLGNPVYFAGHIKINAVASPVLEGNEIRIYKSYWPVNVFGRWNTPTLIVTTKTVAGGGYFQGYKPTDTAYYRAVCIYKGEVPSWRPVTSGDSPWIKVTVRNPIILKPINT